MSNETKRDVFNEVLDEWQVDETMPDANWKYPDFKLVRIKEERFKDRYDAALPDDLPVIPKAVGEYIMQAKAPGKWGLLDVFWHLGDNISAMGINGLYDWQRWMVDNQEAIARAWLLGVWKVAGTGEIVKLEEEK